MINAKEMITNIFASKPKTTVFLAIALVSVVLILTFLKVTILPKNTPNLPQLKSIDQIVPGSTKEVQLQQIPGRYAEKKSGDKTQVFVGENKPQQYSIIESKNGSITNLIIDDKAEFEFPTIGQYQTKYGAPSEILYGPWQESGYLSHLFLSPGLIVIAHQNTKDIIEVWKIPQNMSLTSFFQQFGKSFSTSPSLENQF